MLSILLFSSVNYVFLLLCSCILIVCMLCYVSSVFIMPTGILRLPWPRFYRTFSWVVRQMPGYIRKDGARSALFLISELCCSIYCLCVNVYCTTATGCQPNCSQQIYHIIFLCLYRPYNILYLQLIPVCPIHKIPIIKLYFRMSLSSLYYFIFICYILYANTLH
jgi:hypothetical protein